MRELEAETQSPDFWNDQDRAQSVLRERSLCQEAIDAVQELDTLVGDVETALELATEGEQEFIDEAHTTLRSLSEKIAQQEFLCKMDGEFDSQNAILEINSGAGGTEAQDWGEMLLRMYLRWAERKGFSAEQLECTPGEEAGIKSSTIFIKGDYAYGHLRSEQGVHRLVRISPFDSNARRHTS
ncbi:MAG: PCRF domain-containing protein, partial [Bdellovibrionales bacterium]|nr:PCRF domain-containing protein [Bdellovibrionales bacterium]